MSSVVVAEAGEFMPSFSRRLFRRATNLSQHGSCPTHVIRSRIRAVFQQHASHETDTIISGGTDTAALKWREREGDTYLIAGGNRQLASRKRIPIDKKWNHVRNTRRVYPALLEGDTDLYR